MASMVPTPSQAQYEAQCGNVLRNLQRAPHQECLKGIERVRHDPIEYIIFIIEAKQRITQSRTCKCPYCTDQEDNALLIFEEALFARKKFVELVLHLQAKGMRFPFGAVSPANDPACAQSSGGPSPSTPAVPTTIGSLISSASSSVGACQDDSARPRLSSGPALTRGQDIAVNLRPHDESACGQSTSTQQASTRKRTHRSAFRGDHTNEHNAKALMPPPPARTQAKSALHICAPGSPIAAEYPYSRQTKLRRTGKSEFPQELEPSDSAQTATGDHPQPSVNGSDSLPEVEATEASRGGKKPARGRGRPHGSRSRRTEAPGRRAKKVRQSVSHLPSSDEFAKASGTQLSRQGSQHGRRGRQSSTNRQNGSFVEVEIKANGDTLLTRPSSHADQGQRLVSQTFMRTPPMPLPTSVSTHAMAFSDGHRALAEPSPLKSGTAHHSVQQLPQHLLLYQQRTQQGRTGGQLHAYGFDPRLNPQQWQQQRFEPTVPSTLYEQTQNYPSHAHDITSIRQIRQHVKEEADCADKQSERDMEQWMNEQALALRNLQPNLNNPPATDSLRQFAQQLRSGQVPVSAPYYSQSYPIPTSPTDMSPNFVQQIREVLQGTQASPTPSMPRRPLSTTLNRNCVDINVSSSSSRVQMPQNQPSITPVVQPIRNIISPTTPTPAPRTQRMQMSYTPPLGRTDRWYAHTPSPFPTPISAPSMSRRQMSTDLSSSPSTPVNPAQPHPSTQVTTPRQMLPPQLQSPAQTSRPQPRQPPADQINSSLLPSATISTPRVRTICQQSQISLIAAGQWPGPVLPLIEMQRNSNVWADMGTPRRLWTQNFEGAWQIYRSGKLNGNEHKARDRGGDQQSRSGSSIEQSNVCFGAREVVMDRLSQAPGMV